MSEVGFSFIRAHSAGLFEKGPATLKDMELNVEAFFLLRICSR